MLAVRVEDASASGAAFAASLAARRVGALMHRWTLAFPTEAAGRGQAPVLPPVPAPRMGAFHLHRPRRARQHRSGGGVRCLDLYSLCRTRLVVNAALLAVRRNE